MPILTTTTRVTYATRLPRGTTHASALAMLADHEFFLACGPHMAKYERITASDDNAAKQSRPAGPEIPDFVKEKLRGGSSGNAQLPEPHRYRVTDNVNAGLASMFGTHVVSEYEFVHLPDGGGLYVRVRSPMGIVMDSLWEVREADQGQDDEPDSGSGSAPDLDLVQNGAITASRFLVGVVKGQCDDGSMEIHRRLVKRLEEREVD
ncbi:hypothetical protein VTJ83DRAFT_2415 [Remersonia thermophila]|uniref:DUF7053 domain-containing protein n=1 Tax=Remersonia thermophila TaxID=72144 RepID=A0ABR4DK60_9PEZI